MATKNANLHGAKRAKNDEFYTRIQDVEAELYHYRPHFKDKVVYLNCDDPRWSAFWRFFCLQFSVLGLKGLIATHYTGVTEPGEPSFMIEAKRGRDDTMPGGWVDPKTGGVQTPLEGDGDFRSPECVELLKRSDIVVTNPPFSLFREYIGQLMEYDKEFVVMANKNSITYKEVWPYIHSGNLWVGATSLNGGRWMILPSDIEVESDKVKLDSDGNRILNVAGVCWFTNLDHHKRHEELITWKKYSPEEFPHYDNYDAIEVSQVKHIPADYDGIMGVPITFLDKWNPEQFEFLGASDNGAVPEDLKLPHFKRHNEPYVDGRKVYKRLFIRPIKSQPTEEL